MGNPRYKNGNLRRKNRQRLKLMGGDCGICKGRFGPIRYVDPSDHRHPFSFVVDEIIPVSKYWLGGYRSASEAAADFNNLQPAHYICNLMKSNKTSAEHEKTQPLVRKKDPPGGEW